MLKLITILSLIISTNFANSQLRLHSFNQFLIVNHNNKKFNITTPLTGKEPIPVRKEKVRFIIYKVASKTKTTSGKLVKKSKKHALAVLEIIRKESTYNPKCTNPSSSSKGLNGFLKSDWKGWKIGLKPSLDPEIQIEALFRYVDRRFKGNPLIALSFHKRHNWY